MTVQYSTPFSFGLLFQVGETLLYCCDGWTSTSMLASQAATTECYFQEAIDAIILSDDEDDEVVQQYINHSQDLILRAATEYETNQFGGTRPSRKANINRGAQQLLRDYFSENPTYGDSQFRRRFRMSRDLFTKIVADIESANLYFVQKPDATGKLGLTSLQKCTAAIRQLAYGMPADAVDEYLRLAESTALKCLEEFCGTTFRIYSSKYLRYPTPADVERLLRVGNNRGFPGMLGSLDCCHWIWKNCPTAWAGQFRGKEKKPTIVLEAVASYDLWIWHAFFGIPGSNNDVNVLDRSPLFSEIYEGKAPPAEYTVNGRQYSTGYYLADGIYPPLATLVQTISSPVGLKKKYFAQMQESARKDVERAFGVLMARFAIIKTPARLWNKNALESIIKTCIILHNMIIENEKDDPLIMMETNRKAGNNEVTEDINRMDTENVERFDSFLSRYKAVHDTNQHYQLRNDLIEHLWAVKGEEY
ncbi:uncharacterized protein LOC134221532 [Armigeres subalbatus]|uniref:uncharacterized protein LOC134221532 n=1 Tax=Armigeres subalbatus TaxID=124917 RepID=UPI002ED32096